MVHVAEYHARFAHVHARELDDLQIQPDLIPRQVPQVAVIDHRLLPHRLGRHPTLPRSKALLWPQTPSCAHPAPPSPSEAILAAPSSDLCGFLHTYFQNKSNSRVATNRVRLRGAGGPS